MAVGFHLEDPTTGQLAKVNGEGELNVVVHPHPPIDETVDARPFRQFFTDDGTSTGGSDMLQDGSSTPVDFYISAQEDVDIYIKTISVSIVDASGTLAKFGNLAALSNGVKFFYEDLARGEVVIHDGIKTNYEFMRLASGKPSFGDGANAFRAGNAVSTSEAFLPIIDMSETFGFPWGIRLRKGTADRMVFTVRDNVSTMDGFDIIGFGIQI